MEFDDNGLFVEHDRTLLIDGDILVYKPCCIFTDDDENSKELIANNIKNQLGKLCEAAECTSYRIFLTTKKNFRDFIADDYKANRKDLERPVNLTWAKRFCMEELGGEVVIGLEADDLLSINQTEDTVIWSPDKDLRQVPGMHLDIATNKLKEVSKLGELYKIPNSKPTKYYFSGFKGLMFQALVGDTADYIIGCGRRLPVVTKSGPNKGKTKIKRVGVGPLKAYELLKDVSDSIELKKLVLLEYHKLYEGDRDSIHEMEKQVNLLYMVEKYDGADIIVQWTFDDRYSEMNIKSGAIYE